MRGFPVWFDDQITQGELRDLLQAAGFVLRARNGIISVAKIPDCVRADSEEPLYGPS